MLFALYNFSSKIYIMSGKCKELINVSLALVLVWNRHQKSQGMIWQEKRMAKRKTVAPKTRYSERQVSKQTKKPNQEVSLQNIWEKNQALPSQHWSYALVTSPFTSVDTNAFLHLLENTGKIPGPNKKKKKKSGGRKTFLS